MRRLTNEVAANFQRFSGRWKSHLQSVLTSLANEQSRFRQSYFRLTSIQAWRSELLEGLLSSDALEFFLEAQNDAVLSHVLAHLGCWRSALQALRSCIENAMRSLYYMDHPVEVKLWHAHKHHLPFAELTKYFSSHPQVSDVAHGKQAVASLRSEYQTLSRAVHASAKSFRMTLDPDRIVLFSDHKIRLKQWSSREKRVLSGLNLLLLSLFRTHLAGARLPNLRKAVSLAISGTKRPAIRKHLSVRLPKPQ